MTDQKKLRKEGRRYRRRYLLFVLPNARSVRKGKREIDWRIKKYGGKHGWVYIVTPSETKTLRMLQRNSKGSGGQIKAKRKRIKEKQ